ncbi:glycosyltransferase [Thermomonas sp.]|uniref:glycosyltransferase family 2 protein n=1 Tax=Thermomonas sp. TaxID=1971895 RepID=UPI002B9CE45C|nr:glycosyltransferase [Thermomonas sp.]HRO63201.1 glycosyltransferase [Thermomonas sp.]
MNTHPDVSVLMGVYNAAPTLARTLDSILTQEGVALEFIVVDDGSTDGSGEILDRAAARDSRLVVLHQANAGLTISLQRASELARGKYLARQDAGGDRSLPGRLAAQVQCLNERKDAVFATCGHRYLDAGDVFLCDEIRSEEEIKSGLTTLRYPGVRGILHPSVMIVADAFRAAGGYRAAFVVAQDIDLWLRLHELGTCAAVPEILYDYRFDLGGISRRRYAQQMAFAELAVRCAQARRNGKAEPPLVLQQYAAMDDDKSSQSRKAEYHYFVGSCLRDRDPSSARSHFLMAWRAQPHRFKPLIRAVLTW